MASPFPNNRCSINPVLFFRSMNCPEHELLFRSNFNRNLNELVFTSYNLHLISKLSAYNGDTGIFPLAYFFCCLSYRNRNNTPSIALGKTSQQNTAEIIRLPISRMSKIRYQYAILTPSWLVPSELLTFQRHFPATKANVLLTFCTYKVLYTKKAGGKNCRGTSQTMRCARTSTSKVPTESDFWLISILSISSQFFPSYFSL